MAYAAIHPFSPVTDEMRKLFVRLVLKTEPESARIWTIAGTEQARIRRDGKFYREGRYVLKAVAKKWAHGFLAAGMSSAKDSVPEERFYVKTPELVALSTNRATLEELFPGTEVLAWHYDSGVPE
jgi:hypothetical protein